MDRSIPALTRASALLALLLAAMLGGPATASSAAVQRSVSGAVAALAGADSAVPAQERIAPRAANPDDRDRHGDSPLLIAAAIALPLPSGETAPAASTSEFRAARRASPYAARAPPAV